MSRLTLTIINFIFFTPIIIFASVFYKKKIIQYKKLLIFAVIFGFVGFLIVEPLATAWGAWRYDYNQSLHILIGKSVFETLIWAVMITPIVALIVAISAEGEEKRKR